MPDPTKVKLRPGATTPKNVKLYPWVSAGSLTITEEDSGAAVDAVYVDRVFDIVDSGVGTEIVEALIPSVITVSDAGVGEDAVLVEAWSLYHRPSAIPRIRVFPNRAEEKKPRATLKVYAAVILEENLSPSKNPARLIKLRLPTGMGDNTIEHVRSGWINDEHEVTTRHKGTTPIPTGYDQGGRSVKASAIVNGRSTILDAFLSDTGDSGAVDLIEFHCRDPQGLNASIYLINARILSADPVFRERETTIYEYRIKADKWTFTPPIGVLKMEHKPVSTPLTITIIHPVIMRQWAELEVLEGADYFNTESWSSGLKVIPEHRYEDTWPLRATLEIREAPEAPDALQITTISEAIVT